MQRREFGEAALPALREAVADLSWLLGRGYAEAAALKLVGDRLQLTRSQREAVRRAACSDGDLARRRARRRSPEALAGADVAVDGFNVLITCERATAGALVFRGRDGALRDLGGVHGTWRRSGRTPEALAWIDEALAAAEQVRWLLDRPVSNSGRLAGMLREHARQRGRPWTVEVVERPDPELAAYPGIVASSDGAILQRCRAWCEVLDPVLARHGAWIVDLGDRASQAPSSGLGPR